MQGIYIIKNKITNQCYVGQSVNIEARWRRHKQNLKQKNYADYNKLYPAMDKYGIDNFELSVVEFLPGASRSTMLAKEEEWIEKLDSINNGYNRVNKGNYVSYWEGKSRDEDTRAKISVTLTGTKLPKEVKVKIGKANSKSMIGNTNGSKKVRCVETGQVFESIKAAAESIGRHPSGITVVLKGRKKTCGGYHWILD